MFLCMSIRKPEQVNLLGIYFLCKYETEPQLAIMRPINYRCLPERIGLREKRGAGSDSVLFVIN